MRRWGASRRFIEQLFRFTGLPQDARSDGLRRSVEVIPRSPGHEQEWVDMMRGGAPAYSNFAISAYLNEVILLGCVAQRIGEGHPLDWDGPNMKAKGNDAASALVKRSYREGWAPKI